MPSGFGLKYQVAIVSGHKPLCFDQLSVTKIASALLDVYIQLIKTWPVTVVLWKYVQ